MYRTETTATPTLTTTLSSLPRVAKREPPSPWPQVDSESVLAIFQSQAVLRQRQLKFGLHSVEKVAFEHASAMTPETKRNNSICGNRFTQLCVDETILTMFVKL